VAQVVAGDPAGYSGLGAPATSANYDRAAIPLAPGTLTNLRVRTEQSSFPTGTITATLTLNGVNTAITCSITGLANSCTDTTGVVLVAEGDTAAIQVEYTGTGAATRINYSIQLLMP
jgi:hypothetical protein